MILGIDPGQRRVGVASADPRSRFASPLEVIDTRKADPIERISKLVTEMDVELVVVGRPVTLSGKAGPAVAVAEVFVAALRDALRVEVKEFDERFTTVVAEAGLRASGAGKRARASLRDAVAAQVMLQNYLDSNP
jgi:putative Holliday junction resolvase